MDATPNGYVGVRLSLSRLSAYAPLPLAGLRQCSASFQVAQPVSLCHFQVSLHPVATLQEPHETLLAYFSAYVRFHEGPSGV
jgi:hypothetical protein